MENKRSFGEYITQKRKQMGFTQKSLAEKLYVTESAVSKWERGLSYPDITLIKDLCAALDITEHELLTASEDTKTRNDEKLAKKYMAMVGRYKLVLSLLYGLSLPICLICNLAIDHTLSWFFIVFFAELVAFSLTLLPVLVEKKKGLVTLSGFTLALLLLLFTCAIYTGGDWFLVVSVSVVFGLSLVFSPFVVRAIWLPEPLTNHKAAVCFGANTILLFLLLLITDLYAGSGQFIRVSLPIAAFSLAPVWAIMLIIRYAKINGFFKAAGCFGVLSLFDFTVNGLINRLLGLEPTTLGFNFNFSDWSHTYASENINAIVFFCLFGLSVLFALAGIVVAMRQQGKK